MGRAGLSGTSQLCDLGKRSPRLRHFQRHGAPWKASGVLLAHAQSDGSALHCLGHALRSVLVGFIITYVNVACVAVVSRVPMPSARRVPTFLLNDSRRRCGPEGATFLRRFVTEACQPRAPPLPPIRVFA